MKKIKNLFRLILSCLTITMLCSCATEVDLIINKASDNSYLLTLNSMNGGLENTIYRSSEDGSVAKTSLNNQIKFGYEYACKPSSTTALAKLKALKGKFYNVSPITGLLSINVNYDSKKEVILSYSTRKNGEDNQLSIKSNENFTFPYGYNYFSISSGSEETIIKEINIRYSCNNIDNIVSLSMKEEKNIYTIGDEYLKNNGLSVKAIYQSKKEEILKYDSSEENGYSLVGLNSSKEIIDLNKPFLKAGKYYIHAEYKGLVSNEIEIYVKESTSEIVKIEDIKVSPTTISLNINESVSIQIDIIPSYASNKELDYQVIDASVAAFEKEEMKIKALNKGKTSLIIKTKDGSNIQKNIPIEIMDNPGYYRPSSLTNNLKDAQTSKGYDSLSTLGEQSILVIPVELNGAKKWTSEMLNKLNIAFFGEANETNYWESVKSFYDKSSYSKFSLSGEVTPVFKSSYSKNQISQESDVDTKLFNEFYNQADASLLKKYDKDNNGHIDASIFIYSNDYDQSDSSQFWAWVWYLDNTPNLNKPTIGTYMWASYAFMEDGVSVSNQVDAHTYIHEFGHVLGLNDYYNTDGSWDPVGQLEMQSYNVGDQSVFSKLQLEWSNPYVIDGTKESVDITLKTSALYDESILINDKWNGGSEDEYILVEYYTPKGNNYKDSLSSYNSRDKMYTTSGLRIYHVDARLAKLNPKNDNFISYSDKILDDGYVYFPGASNSRSWSYLSSSYADKYKLVQLMQANVTNIYDKNHLKNDGKLTNATLYGLNQTFKASSTFFTNGTKFNDGSEVGYSITMISKSDEECIVRIQKI